MVVLNQAKRLELLEKLVAIPSVNDHEQAVAQFLNTYLAKYGISSQLVQVAPDRACLVAQIGTGTPCLALAGHLDVVAATASAWQSDPFVLTERNEKLYGRGASDMKAGVAALVIALIELVHGKKLPKGQVRLLLTVGEEMEQAGSKLLYEQGYMQAVDALLIAEPTDLKVAHAHKGSMDISVISRGKSAHSSMPEQGYNALEPLIEFLYQTKKAFLKVAKPDELLGNATFNATVLKAGSQVNSLPELATAEINVRTTPTVDNEKVQALIELWKNKLNATGAKLTTTTYLNKVAVKKDPDSSLVHLAQALGEKYLGQTIKKIALAPVTDASNLTLGKPATFPLAIFGPGNQSVHQVDEYVDKSQYLAFCELYQAVIVQYLEK